MANQPLLGIRTTIYKVTEVEKATEWYTKAFGVDPYFVKPFYVGFNIAGYELDIHPDTTPASEKSDNVLSYWGVEEVASVYAHLLSLGATELEKPTNVGGEIVVAAVKDPWGNAVGLIYNPEFKLL